MRPFRPALAAVTAVTVLAVGLAGCGSGSSGGSATTPTSNSSAPADPTKATADITTTWTTLFHTGTDPQAAALLLQNGAQLGRAIKVAAKIQKQTKVKEDARVNKVVFSSPTAATVTYELLSHGKVLLPNATGQAVFENGKWLVSQATFCTLVQLGAGSTKVPGC